MYINVLPLQNKSFGENLSEVSLGHFSLSEYSTKNLRVGIAASGVAGTCTVKLQGRIPGGDYEDLGAVSVILGNGSNHILVNIEDFDTHGAYMPLPKTCRLVLTTGAGAAVTVEQTSIQVG